MIYVGIVVGLIGMLALAVELGRRLGVKSQRMQIEALEQERVRLLVYNEGCELRKNELEADSRQLRDENLQLHRDVSRLQSEAMHLSERLESHKNELADVQKAMADRFEVLAKQIFESNSNQMASVNQKSLHAVLDPLKDKIREFEKRVEDCYGAEAKERFALQKEIQRLMELNLQMGQDAANLTKALKGDSQVQGAWGEMVLEKILERSGLRDGHEYTRQGIGLDLRDDNGRAFKPDILIHLPDDKHIVIDSKVSLVAYERMVSCSEEGERLQCIKDHVDSVLAHIKGLSDKHYQSLEQIRSPDFVLLFMPIEGAFSVAIQGKVDLFQAAWDKKIVIVSPTTLLATLRTVASIWKHEKQSKNAVEIARQGGALYDEFVRFVEDLKEIGRSIELTQTAYDSTLKRLSFGKGNLVNRVERLKDLGAKAKKDLGIEASESLTTTQIQ